MWFEMHHDVEQAITGKATEKMEPAVENPAD